MKLKEIITKNKWFILIVALVVLWFVWFQLRPSLIRQNCQEYAREMGNTYFTFEFVQKEEPLKRSQLQVGYMKQVYDRCLHDKGIEE